MDGHVLSANNKSLSKKKRGESIVTTNLYEFH